MEIAQSFIMVDNGGKMERRTRDERYGIDSIGIGIGSTLDG